MNFEKIKVILIGACNRGTTYTDGMKNRSDKFEVVAVAEPIESRRNDIKKKHKIADKDNGLIKTNLSLMYYKYEALLSNPDRYFSKKEGSFGVQRIVDRKSRYALSFPKVCGFFRWISTSASVGTSSLKYQNVHAFAHMDGCNGMPIFSISSKLSMLYNSPLMKISQAM